MKPIFLSLFCLMLTCFPGAAEVISETAGSVTFRQPDGNQVEVHKFPRRTVICYASLADLWYGSGGSAVGVARVKSLEALPEAARQLPTVGAVTVPNPEQVLALEPDLVLLNGKLERHRALGELLRQSGIEAVCVEYANYGDFAVLADFFEMLNRTGEESMARRITDEVTAICREYRAEMGPKLAIVFASAHGFTLETPVSNTGMMAEMLGGRNIAAGDRARVDFSYEQLLIDDPEVILVVTMGDAAALREKFREELMSQPAWRELAAARAGRVHFLTPDLFLYQAGTRYPEAFRQLAGLLYPSEGAAPE